MLSFLIVDVPVLSTTGIIVCVILYFAVFAVGVYAFIKVSSCDPTLDRTSAAFKDVADFASSGNPEHPTGLVRFCPTCNDYMPHRTKHCRICKKCVEGFDHHCLYLNTCIAKINYRHFFVLVSSATFVLSLQFALSMYILSQSQSDSMQSHRIQCSFYGTLTTYYIVSGVCNFIVLLVWAGVSSLWGLHCFLGWMHMTTYEWIMKQQAKTDEKEKQRLSKESEKQRAKSAENLKYEQERQKAMNESKNKGKANSPQNAQQIQVTKMTEGDNAEAGSP
jgi:hypothetical protein